MEKQDTTARSVIRVENNRVIITGYDVWMTACELAEMFYTTIPAVNSAIKTILKGNGYRRSELCRYTKLEDGLYADVYSLEIIIPLAFRLTTHCTILFRRWLINRAFAGTHRPGAYVVFIRSSAAGLIM
ncbi:MAG: RhuM protein [Prevotella sp.]|nr:RhuM protein [Prevotella sp.]